MNPSSHIGVNPTSTDVLCTTSHSAATRIVAWVSLAGAIVWGSCLVGVDQSGLNVSSGVPLFLLIVTIHHIGQALASASSFKVGARFATLALTAQLVIAAAVLIGNTESPQILNFLTTPVIGSVCALVIARRHSASTHHEDVG